MAEVIQCVPNFSEGRNQETIDALVTTARSVTGVLLADFSSDKNHNRTVLTLLGDREGILEVMVRLAKVAKERIDMRLHSGEHPRVGAVDVIPVVPIREVSMEACVKLSGEIGARIFEEVGIPSILYEESATASHRKNLAEVRRGGFERLSTKLQEPMWRPDFGTIPDETAGLVVIGARAPLIAFNVNLGTNNLLIAKKIASLVRTSGGGYPFCRAIGVMLHDRDIVQVSMNFTNYEKMPIYRVFETIRFEAERYGVQIIGSELIGISPAEALISSAEYYLKLEDFSFQRQVLENFLI